MALTIHNGPSPQVLLTAADVEQWKRDLVTAEAVVAALKRKLDAAAVFFPANAAAKASADVAPELTVGDWVLRVLRERGKAMTPRKIRAAISDAGGPLGSENYLYTAIQREFRKRSIEKFGDGYRLAPTGSPQGEAGDQKVPGPLASDTLSGGSVEAAPEAGGT